MRRALHRGTYVHIGIDDHATLCVRNTCRRRSARRQVPTAPEHCQREVHPVRIVSQLGSPAFRAASASMSRASIPLARTIGAPRFGYFDTPNACVAAPDVVVILKVLTRASFAPTKSSPLVPSLLATVNEPF